MNKILLIEDEKNVSSFIKKGLEEAGFSVTAAFDGHTGWTMGKTQRFDLIIIDRMLPEMSGFEICKRIREKYGFEIPVIMLTALSSTDDVIEGLEIGADDYITKPFHFKELLARVNARIRGHASNESPKIHQIADLELNDDSKTVTRDGQDIHLTSKEYRLLHYFMTNPRKVLSREELLEKVWDIEFDMGTNTVDVYINYLRNKIDKPFSSRLIHTVIGMGYIMKEE